MANPFYTPSGNPTTGSEGLSALMRGEFIAIGAAFDLIPRISTTGLFDTIFVQTGNYTFTLPSVNGTLATTANIATEAARAQTAEGVLATAVSAETTRAIAAEGVNATAISAEATTRAAAITAEASARTTAIGVETTRATTAEGVNASAITAEATARATAVSAEAAARVAAAAVAAAKSFPVALGTLGTGTTITGTNAGTFYNVGGSSTTQTLNTATFTAGQTIGFLAQSACTIATSSGVFYGGSLSGSSITMGVGAFVALEWDGTNWRQLAGSFPVIARNIQVFATAGTSNFIVPANITQLSVMGVGAGSGGTSAQAVGSTQVSVGAGGNAGVVVQKICSVTPAQSISVTIGAGGSSNANGGSTSFGAFFTAPGAHAVGSAAPVNPPPLIQTPAGPTNIGTGGDVNGTEVPGTNGMAMRTDNGQGGNGAPGPWGGGGFGGVQSVGGNATAIGAGGGGGCALGGVGAGTAFAGGTGSSGIVIVEW